jgi:hypothetical protein
MFLQYLPAERIDLDLPLTPHPGSFEAEIESADTAEQTAEGQLIQAPE